MVWETFSVEPYITSVLMSVGTLHAAFSFMVHEPASFMLPFVLWFMNQLPSSLVR